VPNLTSPTGKPITLKPVRANAGLQAAYRKKLDALIEEMNSSLIYWLSAAYKQSGAMAQDASPAMEMRAAMGRMSSRWQSNFDKGAEKLAVWFADKSKDYADTALKGILKEAGFSVPFTMTPAMNNAYQAVLSENVGLIKSIASQHLTQVEGMVMRSVATGRDLGTLTKGLQAQFGVTQRRAALIARDQNSKATAVMNNARQRELGLKQGRWRHSNAGAVPRPSHVAANGELFDLDKGMLIDGEWILPGEKINCRCSVAVIVPGFID
jgi:SPP1 gp7 family putative phage head morphogenesis protein